MRKLTLCLSVLAGCLSLSLGVPARAGAAVARCAWQYSSLLTNAAWPDSNAEYWITPFTSQADLTIKVHGSYPSARYFSLTAYNALAVAGQTNVIHDTQILPDADGQFTVTVSHSTGTNTIPFANTFNGTTGYLEFRVYLPNGGVQLPSLTFSTTSGSVNVQPCATYTAPTFGGTFDNPDNTYVQMYPTYPLGTSVTVITGKAPTAVRYWSLCSYVLSGAVVDCRYDRQIQLSNGSYHLVLGQPTQKSAIVAAGYTYLQYASMVILRNLLGNQTTGAYAPVMKTCAITDRVCMGG